MTINTQKEVKMDIIKV